MHSWRLIRLIGWSRLDIDDQRLWQAGKIPNLDTGISNVDQEAEMFEFLQSHLLLASALIAAIVYVGRWLAKGYAIRARAHKMVGEFHHG